MTTLFENPQSGARFSDCKKYRFSLWRLWDENKPLVMFIGLNPSTANEATNDRTIESVIRISRHNGFGGMYMMNCFPYISTDPKMLKDHGNTVENDRWLQNVGDSAKAVVFAWGAFKVVKELGRDKELIAMFPGAQCLGTNSDGSPKHPLYCAGNTNLTSYPPQKITRIREAK